MGRQNSHPGLANRCRAAHYKSRILPDVFFIARLYAHINKILVGPFGK